MSTLLDQVMAIEGAGANAPPPQSLDQRVNEATAEREAGTHAQDPIRTDYLAREQNLGGQVGQRELGPPGLDDAKVRADLSLSERFDEKQAKFKSYFPEGDYLQVVDPTGKQPVTLFRRTPHEQYSKVDADALEKFEFTNDLADLSGDAIPAVLEVMLTRGGKLWKQAIGAFTGGAGGEVIKNAIDEFRGYQRETVAEIATRAAEQGAMSAAGAISTVALSGPINALRGRPLISVVPGAERAQIAAEHLGIPRLTAGQIASSPLWRRVSGQSQAIVKNVGDYMREQSASATRALTGMRDQDVSRVLSGDLAKVHDEARTQIIKGSMLASATDLSMGGNAIQKGLLEYDDLSRTLVNRAYANARTMETPVFDPSAATAVADDLAAKASALGRDLPPAVADAVDRLKRFDPNAPPITLPSGAVVDATEQLRAIRSDLWEAKTPAPGEIMRDENVQASKLFSAINKVLEDPRNTSQDFRDAWKSASTEAKMRFDTMDKLMVIRAGKSETPTNLAKNLVAPYQVDNLKLLKTTMPADRWEEFRGAAVSHLLADNNVNSLGKKLKAFDTPTLNALFSAPERLQLEMTARNIDNLNALGLPAILERQTRRGNIAAEVLLGNDRAKVETFGKMIGGNPDVQKEVRAGLIDALIARNTTSVEGTQAIRWGQFNADLDKMLDNGALRFLKADDVKILRDLKRVSEFLPEAGDAGTSIVAGSVAAQATKGPEGWEHLLYDVFRQAGIGRLMTTPTMQRILLGSDKKAVKPLAFDGLRAAGAVAAELSSDVRPGVPKSTQGGSGDDEIKGGAGDDTLGYSLPKEGALPGKANLDPKIAPAVAKGSPRPFAPGEWVDNPDGSWSSEVTATVTNPKLNGGKPTVIPSLWLVNGKPTLVNEDKAAEYAAKSGLTFRSFKSIDDAENYANDREDEWQKTQPEKAGSIAPLWLRSGEKQTVADDLALNTPFRNDMAANPIARRGFDPKAISVATQADGFSDGSGSTMAGMHYPNEVEPATLQMLKEGEKAGRISGPGSSRTTDAIIAAGADYAEMEKTIRHESVHRGISLILGDEKGKRPELDVSPKVKLKEEDLVRIMDYIFIPDEKDTVEKYFKKQGLVAKDLATDSTVLKFLMKYAQTAQEQIGDNKTLLNPKGEK